MKYTILILLLGLFLVGVVGAETFTPIFCNDYEFTCCGGIEDLRGESVPVGENNYYQCTDYSTRCQLQSYSLSCSEVYVGSENCHVEDPAFSNPYFTCSDERIISEQGKFNPGDYIWVKHYLTRDCEGYAYLDSWKKDLGFCGSSGVANEEFRCGISVSGNDACTFSPNENTVYTSTSDLSGKQNVVSYTVPVGECVLAFQSGNRHICGYKEESCSSNSDCGGHTYGEKECIGRSIQTYGCRSYGFVFDGEDRGPLGSDWGNDKSEPISSGDANFGKRCEIISNEQVQCCGDTDCGNGMFCDIDTFTCEEEIECTENYDCGVSVQCDWTTNTLKTPKCQGGKCSYSEEYVDCCLDKNCDGGTFCSDDNTCLTSSVVSDTSPVSGSSSSTTSKKSSSIGTIILVVFLVLIGGSTAFFFYTKNKKKIKHHPKSKPEKIDKEKFVKRQMSAGKHCTKCGYLMGRSSTFCTMCGKKSK